MLSKISDDKTRLKAGIELIANVVGSTMGPSARNVLLQSVVPVQEGRTPDGRVRVTKDGVTVAKHLVTTGDFIMDYGVKMMQDASDRVRSQVGDGTTQVTVLANSMCVEPGAGMNVHEVARGMEEAVSDIIDLLYEQKIDVDTKEKLLAVANVSSNNDPIAEKISQLVWEVGKDGIVYVGVSNTTETWTEKYDGFFSKWGVLNPSFYSSKNGMNIGDPFMFLCDYKLSAFSKELEPILSEWLKKATGAKGIQPLVIVCKDMDGEAAKVVMNARGNFKLDPDKARNYGLSGTQVNTLSQTTFLPIFVVKTGDVDPEMMLDLASMLSEEPRNHFFSSYTGKGIRDFRGQFLFPKTVFSDKNRTVISSHENLAKGRIESLKLMADDPSQPDTYRERYAALTSGIGFLYVGGNTPQQVEFALDVADDVQKAAFSALKYGALPGGGYPLAYAGSKMISPSPGDFAFGYDIVINSCTAPLSRICANAGIELQAAINASAGRPDYGIDIRDGQTKNLVEEGILDPFLSVRESLLAALNSVAIPFVTTKYIITNES